MLYLILIFLANVGTVAGNYLLLPYTGWDFFRYLALRSIFATAAVIALDAIVALLIRRLPERLFAPESRLFSVGRGECRLYRTLRIKSWKRFVPELGGFTSFHKDRLRETSDAEYLSRFLLESNYGVAIHILNALFGPLILLLPPCRAPGIWIPIAATNALLSLLPAMVLRFNTPPLRRLYRRAVQKAQRDAGAPAAAEHAAV